MTVSYRLDTRELDRLAGALKKNRDELLAALGNEVQGPAAKKAPWQTGALSNSIHVVTANSSTYKPVHGVETNEIERPDEGAVRIGPGVKYGVFLELGTSRMAARPYLFPALEAVVNAINQGKFWEKLFK